MNNQTFIKNLLALKDRSQTELIPTYDRWEVLRAVCSFLNTEGGWIVVGYSEAGGIGVGAEAEKIADEIEMEAASHIFPQPLVYAKALEFNSQRLILINVVRGSRQPYALEGKYFLRNRQQIQEAKTDDISLLIRSSNEYTSLWEKSSVVNAGIDDLYVEEIELTIKEANKIGKGETLPNEATRFLSYFQLMDYSAIRNGALILFGREPNTSLPQARIRITVMPYKKTGNKYADSTLIEANLFQTFDRLKKYFTTTLPMISEFKDNTWDRVNREKFPMDALDEALVNAMVHRDYGDAAGEITINIYPDRMEIINSGEIPGDIVTDKNKILPHHSILRNPTISHMFYLRGKMEKLGRGLDLIIESFDRLGLKKPEWVSKNGYTTLTLFSIEEDIVFNERMSVFLSRIIPGEDFTSREYHKYFNMISDKTVRLDIAKFVTGKWVEKIGNGPSTRYIRTAKQLPEVTG